MSASLVHHLVVGRTARVVATVRSGDEVSDAITALWKEELVVGQVFKSRLLIHATHNVTSEKVTGILIRTPEDKFGWVRNRNGWLKRDVSHIKTIKFITDNNNEESK